MIGTPRHRFLASRRPLACALAAATLFVTSCGGDPPEIAATATTTTAADPATSAPSTTTTTAPAPAHRRWIANVKPEVLSIVIHDSPGGPQLQLDTTGKGGLRPVAIDNPLPSGAPTTFLVTGEPVEATGQTWRQVLLPVRPNGSTGWVADRDVVLTHTDMAMTVHLGERRIDLTDAGAVIASYPIAVGEDATPTPTGEFYVKELVEPPQANGAYGPLAYGLSAHSDVLVDTEAFADGVIGIHGTNRPELIGGAVSHGCVRVRNEDVLDLERRQVPLGMPVTIVA